MGKNEKNKLSNIYLILGILLMAILIIYILWRIWKDNKESSPKFEDLLNGMINNNGSNNNNNVGDDNDIIENEESNPNCKKTNQYHYKKNNRKMILKNTPVKQESTITYTDFISIVFNEKFLANYCDALKISFTEKLLIYTNKLKKIQIDLRTAKIRNNSPGHDSSLDRFRRAESELLQIKKAIDIRLKNLSIDQIRKDFEEAIYDSDNGFESLIGREDVKDYLALQIFTFARNPKLFFKNFQNMLIYGKSGVGKTKVGETIGFIYAKSGILGRRKVRVVTKQEFTSAYVNESPQLTRELLLGTLEGVLIIDEAYALIPPQTVLGRGIDHGHEAIAEIVNFLDKNIGLSVVIAAGYEDEMEERFMKSNQGMERRFPHKIKLKDYNSEQLTDILLKFIETTSPDLEISGSDANYIYLLLDHLINKKDNIFEKQAGDMLILSGYITRSIYGSISKTWCGLNEKKEHPNIRSSEDDENNEKMILDGFNDYLRIKNMSISEDFNNNSRSNRETIENRLNKLST